MKNNYLLKICISLFALSCLVRPAIAGDDDIDPSVLQKLLASREAQVVTVDQSSDIFTTPDSNRKLVRSVSWNKDLNIDTRRLASAPPGWIPLKREDWYMEESDFKAKDYPNAWIRRRDVALPQDFKKIVGCWPIKDLDTWVEDESVIFLFEANGAARVLEYEEPPARLIGKLKHRVQLYIAKTLILAREGKKTYLWMGYRPKDRAVYLDGAVHPVVYRPDSELQGCESGLRLAP